LNINLYNSINELRNDPNLSANPQGLASAMDEVLNKTLQDVDDNDVKMNVMVDYQLKKNTYVNHAQTEFKRIQKERARRYAYDSIYNNTDTLAMSLSNVLTGNYTEDDIVNFQHSAERIRSNVNAIDTDGDYVFSDAQRRKFLENVDKGYVESFKSAYNGMSREQKRKIGEMLDNDSLTIGINKDGEEMRVNISDIVGEKAYKDIKKSLRTTTAVNEDMAYDFMNSDVSNDEKVAYINQREFDGDISSSFASKARRILKTEAEGGQKTLSDAQAITDVLQRASDLINNTDTDEEYLTGLNNLKKDIFEMQGENKMNSKDAVALWNQVSSLTRNKTAEATRGVSWAFDEVSDFINESLPPESRAEAIRELFYATDGKDLDKVNLNEMATKVVKSIRSKNKAKAIEKVNTAVAETNKSNDDFFKGFGL